MPISGNRPMIVKFNDTSTGDGLTYVWDFGDGNTSNTKNPQHTYMNAGEYNVVLTVSNEYGSSTTRDTVTVVSVVTGMQYLEDYDLNGDGGLNILDVQGWVAQGRQDIAAEVLDFVSGAKPMPPHAPSTNNEPGGTGTIIEPPPEPPHVSTVKRVVPHVSSGNGEGSRGSGNTGRGCFQVGTSIEMIDGIKNIEDVKVGDIVKTFNIKTDSVETSNVTETFIHENNTDGIFINVSAGIIRTTSNHPFYSNGDWVEAGDLNVQDKILHVDGVEHTINSIEKLPESKTVYNFEVNGTHNYFAEGYLVHNKRELIK